MMKGIVLFYDRAKSWGFIGMEESDVFVHRTSIIDNRKYLIAGDHVEFEIIERAGKTCAVKVHVLAEATASKAVL